MQAPRHIGQEIRTLNNLLRRNLELRLRRYDLTLMQAWIIGYITRCGEKPVYQRDLEKEFSISRSTASGILDLMEERGYICRQKDRQDARMKRLCLTEKAQTMQKDLQESRPMLEQYLADQISPGDMEAFYRVCGLLRERLETLVECQNRMEECKPEQTKEECGS